MRRSGSRLPRVLPVLALLAVTWGCGQQPEASRRATPAPSPSTTAPSTSPGSPSTPSPSSTQSSSGGTGAVTKLLVVVEENHSLDQMRTGMPYTFSLARRFGFASSYYAITHPSLPNYIAIASGQTYGISDDDPPSAHPLRGHTVFGQALAHGRTAGVYADGMATSCATENQGTYAVKHNPWAYFVDERSSCRAHDVPLSRLWDDVRRGELPDVGMVVPDLCHDAHDCGLSVADAWVRTLMSRVFDGPDWKSGHLAVVVTADEDDGSAGNRVLTVVVHPSQRHHVVSERLDHYALTRLYEDVAGAPYLRHARTAASMAEAFGLPVR